MCNGLSSDITCIMTTYTDMRPHSTESKPPNACDYSEQHKGDRDSWRRPVAIARRARHPHEVPVQGHGLTRMGGRQRKRTPRLAREGTCVMSNPLSVSCDLAPVSS